MEGFDFNIEARHVGEANGLHRVKVSAHVIGLHIMAMTVRRSKKNGDWWVQPPAHKGRGFAYFRDINFDHSCELWLQIERACIEQVELHISMADISESGIKEALDKAVDDLGDT